MPNRPLILRAASIVEPLQLLVDGYPDRGHKLNSRIGGEPLEDGRFVTDHVVATPIVLALTGIVSDLPGIQRPAAAWQAIENLYKRSQTVTAITEWQTYPEMVIGKCEGTPVGRGLRFEMELREILRVGVPGRPLIPPAALTGLAAFRAGEVTRGRIALDPVEDIALALGLS